MNGAEEKRDPAQREGAGQGKERRKTIMKRRLFPVGFMFVITLVFISVTTVIYTLTRDTIELNETILRKRSILYAAGVEVPQNPREVDQVYTRRVEEARTGEVTYYRVSALDTDQVESYVVIVQGSGLWGTITAAVGFQEDLRELAGIEIIDQNETPGLGARIDEPWFKRQFRGKRPPLSTVPEDARAEQQEFQAITGATYSSNAIRTIINDIARDEIEKIAAAR
jgi:Na+-transporting NADH:ubiquinone oxidoreductase subunit C